MIDINPETLFNKGLQSLARNEWTAALACFEKAAGLRDRIKRLEDKELALR